MKKILAAILLIMLIVVPFAVAFATSDVIVDPTPQSFQEFLSSLLLTFLTAAAPVITGFLISLITAWRKKIWGDKYGTAIQTGVSAATDILFAAVVAVNQEYVDALKGSGNIFTAEAQAEARKRAKDKALELITDVSKSAVESLYGSFDLWLDVMLEKLVTDAKNAKAVSVVETFVQTATAVPETT